MKKYRVYTHADFVFAEIIEAESEEQALEIHKQHKDMSAGSDWDFCDDIDTKVEEEKPSLADVFDKRAKTVRDKREAARQRLMEMDVAEREYIEGLSEKLSFLSERGFKFRRYFGGIVNEWPYNYLTISKGMRAVEIKGSSVRRKDGTLDVLSSYYANYQHPTLEEVIKVIAEW